MRISALVSRLALCTLIASVAAEHPAAAQQPLSPAQLEQLLEQARGQQGLSSSAAGEEGDQISDPAWAAGTATGPLLERTISRTDYTLGPGDRLTLSIFGYRNRMYPLSVSPEGTVLIPSVGVVPVAGLSLEEAAQRTRRRVLRVFPDAEVDVTLTAVRSFKIFVVGDVDEPGTREATAVTRVSEVIPAVSDGGVVYRNVVIRRGPDSLRVDLHRFLQTGDLLHNPVLREGDIVQVPAVDRTVTIAGEVAYPGTYEFRAGESLADLLKMANPRGQFLSRAADTLLLMRFTADPRGEILTISREHAIGPLGSQMLLDPFDAVFIPRLSRFMEQTVATIQGEVPKPGVYPIRPDVTTVRDLVEMAGGFSPEASPVEAVLRRSASAAPGGRFEPLATIPPELLTRDEQRVLQVTSRADEENVIIDVTRESPAYDLPLQNGDLLFVPKRRDEVVVLGAVARPGLVVYREGQSIEDFVEMAGGYIRRADPNDVVVLRTRLGTRLHRRDLQSIEPGDRIVVPFRERTTFLERVQTAQGVINTVSGLVLTIVGLERLWEVISN